MTEPPSQDCNSSVLVVDDHPLFRDALYQLLKSVLPDAAIATASSAEEGLLAAATLPNLKVVSLDLGLPRLRGTEAVAAFRRSCPGVALLVISGSDDRREVTAAFRAGATAFVSKSVSNVVLMQTMRRALDGDLLPGAWVTTVEDVTMKTALPGLTPRQCDVLALLYRGYSNKEIGIRLGLAEITVKLHMSSIFRALGVVNRTQAVAAARRLGLIAARGPEINPSLHDATWQSPV